MGQIYTTLQGNIVGTANTLVRSDLGEMSGPLESRSTKDYIAKIKEQNQNGYDRLLRNRVIATKINIGIVLLITVLIMMTADVSVVIPLVVGGFVATILLMYLYFPSLMMYDYNYHLAAMIASCRDSIGNSDDLSECWEKYRDAQTVIEAAMINADSRRDAAEIQARSKMQITNVINVFE